ncbi:MAG: transglycosylase domain-containing protein [Bacillota bacterium]|nr:penicillin-binding protein 1A [Clostridia bacterium]
MTARKRKKRKVKIFRIIILSLILFLIIGCGSALGYVLGIVKDLPEWSAADLETESTSFIYDANGDMFVKLHTAENRTPVELSAMPTYLIDAFIATEDVRFYQHPGVDVRRIIGALIADIRNRSFSEGASTLTMQLVRNAILEDQEKRMERKIKEAFLAIQVERHYTKDEILSFYLNEIYFGHGAHGVQAAAQHYFGKDVGDLTLGESAMLAGLVRNPRIYSPFLNPENAIYIRNVVLNNMVRYNKISQAEADQAKEETLNLAEYKKTNDYLYPWFTDYVIDQAEDLLQEAGLDSSLLYTGGLKIYSTLDPKVQKAAEEAYSNEDNFPKSSTSDPIQSAMAVMDPKTGQVKALIGGREYQTKRGLNRATDIKRQPGSAIKPIAVYAPALEQGFSPSSVVDDVPTTFGSASKPYRPTNYDGKYRGLITMREAVQYSVNVPAVKFLSTIGISEGFNFAKKLGLPLDDKNDKNLSLALGGLTHGVSPLNLAAAYSAFANQGVYIEPHVITKIVDQNGNTIVDVTPKKTIAMKEQTAYLMTDMLKTVVNAGTGTRAKMNRPVAGKTGTTQLPDKPIFNNVRGSSNKDAWFAGYTPELVGVVWMGYDEDVDDNGKPNYLKQVYGGQYPARIWKYVMEKSLEGVPVTPFTKPPGIVTQAVDIKTGKLPSDLTPDGFIRNEIFAKNNVPTETSDVWVTASICAESKLLANSFCPTKVNGVFLNKTLSYEKALDAGLYLPASTCKIHGGLPTNAGTELIGICTDPRHEGILYLANYPQEGELGGCPQEFIEFRSFQPGMVPSDYCKLPEHQVLRGASGDNHDENDQDKDDDE